MKKVGLSAALAASDLDTKVINKNYNNMGLNAALAASDLYGVI